MLRISTVFLYWAALFGLTPLVHSQDVIVPRMPNGAALPTKVFTNEWEAGNIPWVWVAYEGYEPRELPGENQRAVKPAKKLKFLQACCSTSSLMVGREIYQLLVPEESYYKGVKEYLGWVNERYLLGRPRAQKDLDTQVLEKVLLVNAGESLKNERKEFRAVPFFLKPERDLAPAANPLRLASILFVYLDSNLKDNVNGFVLVGSEPQFRYRRGEVDTIDNQKEAARVIIGWVPKDRTCLWRTREALEWDGSTTAPTAQPRRTTPGRAYRTLEDALKALSGEPADALLEETIDKNGVSIPFPHNRLRYPILDFEYNHRLMSQLRVRDNVLRRVAFIGGFVNDRGQEIRTKEQIEDLRTKLAVVEKQARQTEILFVIDDTESMDAWFPIIAQTADDIIAEVRKDPERQVRLAVTYYNDTEDGKNLERAVTAAKLVDAGSDAGQQMIQELKKHKVTNGFDPREQVFLGIKRGIEEAGFEPYSRKIVIVIGDMGDHADENDPQHSPENEIVDKYLFQDRVAPIEFYAIQVIDPETNNDSRAFKKQMSTILDLYWAKLGDKNRGGYLATIRNERVRETILQRYQMLHNLAHEYAQQIGRLRLGQFDNTHFTPEGELMLKNLVGDDFEVLRKSAGSQVLRDAYVWSRSNDGINQTRVCLLLTDGELHEYLDFLKKLDLNRNLSVRKLLEKVIKTQTGEQKATFETQPQLERNALKANSWLLKKALGEIPEQDDAKHLQEMQKIRLKIRKLEDVLNDCQYEYRLADPPPDGRPAEWVRGQRTPKVRRFTIGQDSRVFWYWIDFEEEWP